MPLDAFSRPLTIGDRVVYTARHELYCGIIIRLNTYKATIKRTDENFQTNNRTWDVPIDFGKIYKITGKELN